MLTNEQPEQFALTWDALPCQPHDTVLCFWKDTVLLCDEHSPRRLPTYAMLMSALAGENPMHAFTQGTRRVFILTLTAERTLPEGIVFAQVRAFRMFESQEEAYFLLTAYHLAVWYARHRYCGACGGTTQPAREERALVCGQCGFLQYPTISPAIIVAITDEDRLLLARNAQGAFRHYSLIAGYVEAGETLEQAVRREIMEEVGLRVRDVRYLASQPWGLSQSMMIGFHAKLEGSPAITLQQSELSDAQWFRRGELPEHAGPVSIAYRLIEQFQRGELP